VNDRYCFAVTAGNLFLAEEIMCRERDSRRQQKMHRVIEEKRRTLRSAFPEVAADLGPAARSFAAIAGEWPDDQATTLLIDLAFTDPFAPYELEFKDGDFERALRQAARLLHLSDRRVDDIRIARKEAFSAHRHLNGKKIALWGLGGVTVFAAGGWLVAPLIGTAIGVAAGLSGAAATAHGLAILGGGSLALGGAGMAGGMWVVSGAGAAVGLLGGGGSTALLQLGAAQARVELVKLQVRYKVVLLGNQVQLMKAQEVTRELAEQREQIKEQLDRERDLNESNSARVKQIEATLAALEDCLKWMEQKGT
jgi:hypothetical protein